MKPRSQNLDEVALACNPITWKAVSSRSVSWIPGGRALEERRASPGEARASGQAGGPELGPGD